MTVADLIALLQQQPPDRRVVVSLHSEYTEVTQVDTLEGFDNGGYVSCVYKGQKPPLNVHYYVEIR